MPMTEQEKALHERDLLARVLLRLLRDDPALWNAEEAKWGWVIYDPVWGTATDVASEQEARAIIDETCRGVALARSIVGEPR